MLPREVDPMSRLRPILLSTFALMVFTILAAFRGDVLVAFGAQAVEQTQRFILYTAQIGVWLSAAYFLQSLVNLTIWDGMVAKALGHPAPRLLKTVSGVVLYAIALTGIIGYVFQQPVAGIWTTGGVVGLVIGLALQSMIRDVFVGLAVNFDRPFRIGHWIKVQVNKEVINGQVQQVNWRTTRMVTSAGDAIVIPNSLIGQAIITNWCEPRSESDYELHLTLDFAVPTEQARRILLAGVTAVLGEKGIGADPPPIVRVNAVTPLGIEYRIIYTITRSPSGTRDKVLTSVIAHLRRAGLSLAFPKQDVFHAEMPVRHLDATSIDDRVQLLTKVELFADLPREDLEQLAARTQRRRFKAGDLLFSEGEAADETAGMFILFEGLLHVLVRTDDRPDGLRVGQVVPGEFIGEMAVLTGEPRSATVRAVTDARAYEILPEDIARLLEDDPTAMATLSRVCAARRLRTQHTLDATGTGSVKTEVLSLSQQILGKMASFFSRRAGDAQPV
jgi:small-conductance mechanosensitive channel/CRP-like cAMP-binding protein